MMNWREIENQPIENCANGSGWFVDVLDLLICEMVMEQVDYSISPQPPLLSAGERQKNSFYSTSQISFGLGNDKTRPCRNDFEGWTVKLVGHESRRRALWFARQPAPLFRVRFADGSREFCNGFLNSIHRCTNIGSCCH